MFSAFDRETEATRAASARSRIKLNAERVRLAPTSAGRPESKACFQLLTEGLKRPRGAGARSWIKLNAEAACSDPKITKAFESKTSFQFSTEKAL
ncbi:hypothetical protein CW357_04840 [Rummeliibacillus sp. TYF005]|nr:hypothetical protein D1606_00495 [Rummeliibacillus sp. POC4]RPJ96427.1 hypothetical protein CW357_04840 [Rummeliibacillus sp. TYF005]